MTPEQAISILRQLLPDVDDAATRAIETAVSALHSMPSLDDGHQSDESAVVDELMAAWADEPIDEENGSADALVESLIRRAYRRGAESEAARCAFERGIVEGSKRAAVGLIWEYCDHPDANVREWGKKMSDALYAADMAKNPGGKS